MITEGIPHRAHFNPDIVHAGYQAIQLCLDDSISRRIRPGILPAGKD
jgi:hypothetical protein